MKDKEDRISKHLSAASHDMVFGELKDSYLRDIGGYETLKGIPVPVNENGSGAVSARDIILDMARIVGGDPGFVYAASYLEYLGGVSSLQQPPFLIAEAAREADGGDFEDACRLLRAQLRLEPESLEALYLYGRALKACYEEKAQGEITAGSEEYIGSFKAESMDAFELLTMLHPDFAMGYYFLGYAYLNMGLYLKAKLTWEDFIRLSSSTANDESGLDDDQMEDLRHEISGMLLDLEDPVEIELGCNKIMGGDFAGGRDVLSGYTEGRYSSWWPLWYYLGVAESALGNADGAIADFRRVLTISPSNTDAMEELVRIYEATGDTVNAGKYRTKIAVVNRNREADAEEM